MIYESLINFSLFWYDTYTAPLRYETEIGTSLYFTDHVMEWNDDKTQQQSISQACYVTTHKELTWSTLHCNAFTLLCSGA